MQYTGIVRGKIIEFNKVLPFKKGDWVKVKITPEEEPLKGTPDALLKLVGTLTEEEASIFLQTEKECRKIDWEMWQGAEK